MKGKTLECISVRFPTNMSLNFPTVFAKPGLHHLAVITTASLVKICLYDGTGISQFSDLGTTTGGNGLP